MRWMTWFDMILDAMAHYKLTIIIIIIIEPDLSQACAPVLLPHQKKGFFGRWRPLRRGTLSYLNPTLPWFY